MQNKIQSSHIRKKKYFLEQSVILHTNFYNWFRSVSLDFKLEFLVHWSMPISFFAKFIVIRLQKYHINKRRPLVKISVRSV